MTPAELTAWRIRMGWLKGQAAEALGLSPNGYGAYERGFAWHPTKTKLVKQPRPVPKHVELAAERLEQLAKPSRRRNSK